jgi:hypothetical protein
MAYGAYEGLSSASNYLSGAKNAGTATGAVATAGVGLKKRGRPKKYF